MHAADRSVIRDPDTGEWVRTFPMAHDKPKRHIKRWAFGALALVTLGAAGASFANASAAGGTDTYQLEPDTPFVVQMGDGWTVRTACGSPGQRVYITTPTKSSAAVGVSLSVPGGVAVVADKECK